MSTLDCKAQDCETSDANHRTPSRRAGRNRPYGGDVGPGDGVTTSEPGGRAGVRGRRAYGLDSNSNRLLT